MATVSIFKILAIAPRTCIIASVVMLWIAIFINKPEMVASFCIGAHVRNPNGSDCCIDSLRRFYMTGKKNHLCWCLCQLFSVPFLVFVFKQETSPFLYTNLSFRFTNRCFKTVLMQSVYWIKSLVRMNLITVGLVLEDMDQLVIMFLLRWFRM